ncbi:hypothetical protein K461DRAFT_290218 [Myriangium duriaei CBS 260.36]|uniref:Transmembrane protein n=1 Tax=Myriangium duriaei CBS 260.36 TaxID=1168546 RepID=A0A9P4J9V6_9PEZI|nr:hypothetical protein K461DRAFT_290218 [Myriangium duriaei CBS 260.36]
MHPYLESTLTVLFWVVYPLYWIVWWIVYLLVQAGLYILNPLYNVLLFILRPFILVGSFVGQLAYLPIDIIARFETIYIYLGVASLVGVVAGLVLHFTFSALVSVLGLKQSSRAISTYRSREPRRQQAVKAPEVSLHKSPDLPREAIAKSDPARLFARPKLTLQGPSPEGKQRRTLLDETLDEDDDSEI